MSKRLIENWLPIAELGEESIRERRSMTALPPTYYLHVWWARRPLVASRAAILAYVLPEDADIVKFVHVLGIHGDPVKTKQQIVKAKKTGENLGTNPYGYPRAFSYLPTKEEREWLKYEASRIGLDDPIILDPTAGGGSIPFESMRAGLSTIANDLNPVAAFILWATIDIPFNLGIKVLKEFNRISKQFVEMAEPRFHGIYPKEPENAQVLGYLWARTITCPYCDGLIPLSPNWRLAPGGTGVHLMPQTNGGPNSPDRFCRFEIVDKAKDQSEGTVAKGRATCPFPDCGRVIDGDEVKTQAQAGNMGDQLFAVVYKKRMVTKTKTGREQEKWVRGYRAPRPADEVQDKVQQALDEKLPEWEALDVVPNEKFPEDGNDTRPIQYGMPLWRDLFSPRQLLCHGTSVEVFRELYAQEKDKPGFSEATKAAFGYLAIAIDKCIDWNSKQCTWELTKLRMAHTFHVHGFPLKWSFAEMAPLITGIGYDWVLEATAKSLAELIDLARPDVQAKRARKGQQQAKLPITENYTPPPITVTCNSADSLDHLDDHSVDVVVMDPPYYNNVMYAELSDFFYVWLKRTAGYIYPEYFRRPLTDKENEAVANPAKFKGEKGAGALADEDYRERMAAIFAECRRVLKDDGIMTLMFTHKATGAWDALTKGLMEAGFIITASWPINTEAEGSMHIKDKSAANSTIFLVCRPRPVRSEDDEVLFWEDLEPRVRSAVRSRIQDFQAAGIKGVDLYLSSFGPALEEFSRHWPIQRGQPKAKPNNGKGKGVDQPFDPYATSPEDALDAARREVKNWRMEQLTTIQRQAELDPLTEWFVLAWDAFQAPRFPYDEALRLARVVGLDMERHIIGTVAEKKTSDVILWDSETRAAKGSLGATDGSRAMLDALHHAAYIARTKTLAAAREMLSKTGVDQDPAFLKSMSAVLEVLPPSEAFVGFAPADAVLPAAGDFEALEKLRHLAFGEKVYRPRQLSFWEAGK
jgi:adenine-specific DNA methylase